MDSQVIDGAVLPDRAPDTDQAHSVLVGSWRFEERVAGINRVVSPGSRGFAPQEKWAVAELGKRVENRTWRLPCGYLWIHAGARSGWDPAGPRHPALAAAWHQRQGGAPVDPDAGLIRFSTVVALIRVAGAHHAADCARSPRPCDPWAADGQVHNQLELAAVWPQPVPAYGGQRLWTLPPAAESACRVQLAA